MYCVGLTGSVASGKSTVTALFQAKGVDIISADAIAKALVEPGKPAFKTIVQHFGTNVLTDNNTLNRRQLRHIIANDRHQRIWLEQLLHPLIRKQIEHDIGQCTSTYCMIEIPLLTDKSTYPYLNRIILVESDPAIQLARLMTRDNASEKQALALLATSQAHDKQRRRLADDYLINNGSIDALKSQVNALHHSFLNRSTSL